MQRCLDHARNGAGSVSPNPMVGCVVVHNGSIIGEGWHKAFGGPHAEVHAINSVKEKSLLAASTLYVNLEPCAHHGKTPPCASLIIASGIKEVVIGCLDPNPLVAGKGVAMLQQAGVKVRVGVLEKESIFLNRRFIHQQKTGFPYVILKWAQTSNGYLAPDATRMSPEQFEEERHITGFTVQKLVHRWRTEEDALLVGTNTALWDNPALNARAWTGRPPLRAVIDRNLRLPAGLKIFDQSQPTVIFNQHRHEIINATSWVRIDFNGNWHLELLQYLSGRGIQSLIIEGGSQLLQHFIGNEVWNEAQIFISPKIIKEGVEAPHIHGRLLATDNIDDVMFYHYLNA